MRNNLPYAKLFNICRRAWSLHFVNKYRYNAFAFQWVLFVLPLTAGSFLFYFILFFLFIFFCFVALKVISWLLLAGNKLLNY